MRLPKLFQRQPTEPPPELQDARRAHKEALRLKTEAMAHTIKVVQDALKQVTR